MRILVTNDDGAHAPGLWALVRALEPLGEVIVSAPDRDRSGIGTALTFHDPLRAMKLFSPIDGVAAFAVEGTPGDAVVLGLKKLANGPVDIVVSGINPGNNISADVLISGTVGAALHAHLNGIPALAVSTHTVGDVDAPQVAVAVRAAARATAAGADGVPPFLNLNFPLIDARECSFHEHSTGAPPLAGVIRTGLAPRVVLDEMASERRGPRLLYWYSRRNGWGDGVEAPPGTDASALLGGYVSVTPLNGQLCEDAAPRAADAVASAVAGALSESTRR